MLDRKIRLFRLLLLLLFCSLLNAANSQLITSEYILEGGAERIEKYVFLENKGPSFKISFDFGDSIILNPNVVKLMRQYTIVQVDFVYTRYRESGEFNQRMLNESRIRALMKAAPFLFDNVAIEWNVFEIDEAENRDANMKFFHGFAIYARPFTVIKDGEVTYVDKKPKPGHELAGLKKELSKMNCWVPGEVMKVRKRRTKAQWTGKYLPARVSLRNDGKRFDEQGIWHRRKEFRSEVYFDTVMIKTIVPDTSKACRDFMAKEVYASPVFANVTDTVITAILNRKKEWKNMVVVHDVTGSMMPYTLQTLAWRKLNDRRDEVKQFYFFNDGDDKPDGPVGTSGGIYHTRSGLISDIESCMSLAMSRGGGGGAPENNIEALLNAQKDLPEDAVLVMIADNYARVRDIELLPQLSRPVRIIVCGANNGLINTDYLRIAYQTGGSVHTIELDLEELSRLKEDEVIEFGSARYKLKNGNFILTR
jgi:hypothetical protein